MRKMEIKERFEKFYIPEPNTGCWLWVGSYRGKYGQIKIKRNGISSHRISYMLHKGEIASGLCVCHKCATPACVNPDHLFLGTYSENILDSYKKGRKIEPKKYWTHCKWGHEFNEANTYIWKGYRACRKCNAERYHKRKNRKK